MSTVNCIEKTKIKKKRPGIAHSLKKARGALVGEDHINSQNGTDFSHLSSVQANDDENGFDSVSNDAQTISG